MLMERSSDQEEREISQPSMIGIGVHKNNLAKQGMKKSEHDKQVTEALIRQFGPISRVGLYKLTKLRRTTISLITRELLDEGKIIEVGRSNNPLGRKQVLLKLNEEYGFIVGIEFDDKEIVAGVMNLRPQIKRTIHEPTNLSEGREGLLTQLQSSVIRAIEEAGLNIKQLLGIGIADPGLVDSRQGIAVVATTIDFWKDVPLKRIFEEKFGVPTVVESKTRSKTVAERLLGSGEVQDNLIYFDYGAGIGAGVVVDGRLLYGKDCGVGEIGHTRVAENGPACKCGSIGCLEAIASTSAVEARMRRLLSEGAISQVLALAGGDPAKITTRHILAAAAAGDKMCGNVVSELSRYIGLGIANVVNLFNPAVVIFDKRLEPGGDALLDEIARVVKGQTLASFSSELSLRFGEIGEEVGLLGIGVSVLEKRFEIPALRQQTFSLSDSDDPEMDVSLPEEELGTSV
jgi:predicted NBD/HSP70 family sugar kinase